MVKEIRLAISPQGANVTFYGNSTNDVKELEQHCSFIYSE